MPLATTFYVVAALFGYASVQGLATNLPLFLLLSGLLLIAGTLGATALGNQCALKVSLHQSAIFASIYWRQIFAKASDITRVSFATNVKYSQVIVETQKGGFVLHSMLWSKTSFAQLEGALSKWCAVNHIAPPEQIELFGPHRVSDWKPRLEMTQRFMRSGWPFYMAAIVIFGLTGAAVSTVIRI